MKISLTALTAMLAVLPASLAAPAEAPEPGLQVRFPLPGVIRCSHWQCRLKGPRTTLRQDWQRLQIRRSRLLRGPHLQSRHPYYRRTRHLWAPVIGPRLAYGWLGLEDVAAWEGLSAAPNDYCLYLYVLLVTPNNHCHYHYVAAGNVSGFGSWKGSELIEILIMWP